jgi:hypothetical protein
MANQIGPVQQAKTTSTHRPATVSTRFLGKAADNGKDYPICRAIPFLMDDPGLSWITHELCQILTQKGYNSRLCQLQETSNDRRRQHEQGGDSQYWLVPTTSTADVEKYKFDRVVLLVPANLEAVLAAYRSIKRLAQPNTPDIGVVMVGPRDQQSAWHYFRKLAVGTLRYLSIPLLNLGFLPGQVKPEHGLANRHRNIFLARISERLLRSEFYTSYPAQKLDQGMG